jgi:type IV pilus assembly protein PilA
MEITMRAYKRFDKRGFTLVELMIVVAIIGVLAALAIYGVNKYLASSKTAEARNNVGAITRSAVSAYERETYNNELLGDGAVSGTPQNVLCGTATNRVPAATPAGTKVQPSTAAGADFNLGTATVGWTCLRFSITQPIQYSYGYVQGTGTGLAQADATGFEVSAFGDLDGDGAGAVAPGANIATFARGAAVRNGQVVLSTAIHIENETE